MICNDCKKDVSHVRFDPVEKITPFCLDCWHQKFNPMKKSLAMVAARECVEKLHKQGWLDDDCWIEDHEDLDETIVEVYRKGFEAGRKKDIAALMKAHLEFKKILHLQYDQDQDLHIVLSDGERSLSIEIANPFGGGGNREVYNAARALNDAIQKHGQDL